MTPNSDDIFADALRGNVAHVVVLKGGQDAKVRAAAASELAAIPPDAPRVIIATGRYIGEGFDDRRLDTLFLGLPISWRGRLPQYVGRLHRLHTGETKVRVHDYIDGAVPTLSRMFDKRRRGYEAVGYSIRDDSAPSLERIGDPGGGHRGTGQQAIPIAQLPQNGERDAGHQDPS